jgi:NADPH-dependent curcumin reductase CurA
MAERVNHRWALVARPVGMVSDALFRWEEAPVPQPGPGQVLLRNLYLSLDPTNRGWMTENPGYVPPIPLGEVVRGYGIAMVEESRDPRFAPGDLVSGMIGWQEYSCLPAEALTRVPANVPPPTALNVFNATGFSAYFGLLDIGKPQPGETVVVSGAAGAVGSLAGQIARIVGCRVVGIAGGPEKCRWLVEELGFDGAIDYKSENVRARLKELCPDGIDVYFENVGGSILEAALDNLRLRARIVLCGMISTYNNERPAPGPANLINLVLRRARMEGFLVTDYAPRFGEAAREMGQWLAEGKLRSRETVVEGLENAPAALRMLFTGGNVGKLVLKIARDENDA